MSKNTKGLGVIDNIDDKLYIEAGNEFSNVTRLGSKNGSFVPYKIKIDNYLFLSVYSFTSDDLPSIYNISSDFISDLENQHYTNDYIDNYIRLGANKMRNFLKDNNLYNDVSFVYLDNNTSVSEKFHSLIILDKDELNIDIYSIKSDEEFNYSDLTVCSNAPEELSTFLNNQLNTLKRPDRNYNIKDSAIKNTHFRFLSGYINIQEKNIKNIKNKSCIIVSEYTINKSSIFDVIRSLEKHNYKPILIVSLINTK